MKTTRIMIIVATGMVILNTVSCKKSLSKHIDEEEDPTVNVTTPVIDSIVLYKTYPGIISASSSAVVVGKVNGELLTQNYESGSFVNKGQVLFTIESSTYRDAVKQANASLATAKSELEYAASNYAALKDALESDAVSQIEVIQAKSEMEQAEAAVKNAEAALSHANTKLSYCTIKAPLSGYATSAIPKLGEYISGEDSPVEFCTIYNNTEMTAEFNIEDSQYQKMAGINDKYTKTLYQNIPIKFTNSLPHSYSANLVYESPSIDSSTGTLLLKGKIKNIDNELRDGMYVTVDLPYGVNPRAILIKDASIGTDQLGKYVYVVNDSDRVVYTPIKVGDLYQDSLRVVNEGLKPEDRYVTEALLSVRNGMKVNPHISR